MNLKYVNKIKANLSIYAKKKAKNLLDGTYQSVYIGKSLNFENLREYDINDDYKDIDWKSSTRTGSLLVKQYIAEKKYNILFVLDTGSKMEGSTPTGDLKKEIALYTAGTLSYIALLNGDFIGMLFNNGNKVNLYPFKLNNYALEEYLSNYDKNAYIQSNNTINDLLKYINKNIKKTMIVIVITDLNGLDSITDKTLKEVSLKNDIMFVNIEDSYLFGENNFDIDKKEYVPQVLSLDDELYEYERQLKDEMYNKIKLKMDKNQISMVSIDRFSEINDKIVELLEKNNYGSKNRT